MDSILSRLETLLHLLLDRFPLLARQFVHSRSGVPSPSASTARLLERAMHSITSPPNARECEWCRLCAPVSIYLARLPFTPSMRTRLGRRSLAPGRPALVPGRLEPGPEHDRPAAGRLELGRLEQARILALELAHSMPACCRSASGSSCRTGCGGPTMEPGTLGRPARGSWELADRLLVDMRAPGRLTADRPGPTAGTIAARGRRRCMMAVRMGSKQPAQHWPARQWRRQRSMSRLWLCPAYGISLSPQSNLFRNGTEDV